MPPVGSSVTNVADEGTIFSPGAVVGAFSAVVQTFPRGFGEWAKLYLRLTSTIEINTVTDAVYILQHETADAVGIRMRNLVSDTAPVNLLTAWDGTSAVNDVIYFRVPPFFSLEFVSPELNQFVVVAGIHIVTAR